MFNALALRLMRELMPMYALIAVGMLYGRFRPSAAKELAHVLIYVLAPLVCLLTVAKSSLSVSHLAFFLIEFSLCCLVGLTAYSGARLLWRDATPNMLGFACGSGNVGYFGIPVAMSVLPADSVGTFFVATLGFTLYETTVGYFLLARGKLTVAGSIGKLARLPILYGALIGIALAAIQGLPESIQNVASELRGCYVIVGALALGSSLSHLTTRCMDTRALAVAFACKFLVWPLGTMLALWWDARNLGWLSAEMRSSAVILASVPLPINAVVFAIDLDVRPKDMACLVFASTLVALLYVPWLASVLIPLER